VTSFTKGLLTVISITKKFASRAGLPDQTENPNLGKFWRALQWKALVYLLPFGLFHGQLVNFNTIWSTSQPIGKFNGHLVHFVVVWFLPFWYVVPKKIWQPCSQEEKTL
jgi:hypothetical protein